MCIHSFIHSFVENGWVSEQLLPDLEEDVFVCGLNFFEIG